MGGEKKLELVGFVLGKDKTGWGVEDMPPPKDVALIQERWDLCMGCGAVRLPVLCSIAV